MDYLQLWDRYVSLSTFPEHDRKRLVDRLHQEIVHGTETVAVLAVSEMRNELGKASFEKRDEYLEIAAPILTLSALDGYLLFLQVQGVNPETTDLKNRSTTSGIIDRWSAAYQKDKNALLTEAIDPIIGLLLQKIQEVRINQLLALYPEIIKLPYEITERLHQYVGWTVQQGYVLGMLEKAG